MNTDHIITNNLNGKFKCEYCGEEEEPPFMPAPIDVIIAAMDYFMDKHENCTPPQLEQYTTDAMKVRQAVAQALLTDKVYAEKLEQPEAKQAGTISITAIAPTGYLCENAVGHKYFRWKKPPSTYKPIALYTTPQETVMSEYIKGFDAGYDYVLREVENYIKGANSHDALVLAELLAHLKMENKQHIREST